jgi:Domain of unknown function (DUF4345)
MSKRSLQIATAVLAAIPVLTGIIGMSGVSDPVYASLSLPTNTLLDSNLRFFSGVWLGSGLALYWLIPKIDRQTVLFRKLWGMIFLGGIGSFTTYAIHWLHHPRNRGCPNFHFMAGTPGEVNLSPFRL